MEIIIILLTWYATKYYYTRKLTISRPDLDPDMAHATCAKCAQTIYTHVDNLRVPYYCFNCK